MNGYSLTVEPLQQVNKPWHLFKGSWSSVRQIFNFKELLMRLTVRDIRARYKDSSLGLLWSLVRPITLILIYFIAIGHFLGAARAIPDFVIFMFAGFSIWGLFSEIISSSTNSIIANSGLVKKVSLPRELFPLAAVGGSLFNFFIQLILLFLLVVFSGGGLNFSFSAYPIVAISLILVLGTALGLIFSSINVYLRDLQHLTEVLLLVLFWCSPIVYSPTLVHSAIGGSWIEGLYFLNPITVAVLGMQKGLWIAGSHDSSQFWPQNLEFVLVTELLLSVILLWISQRIFSKLEGNFAQEL